LSGAGIAIAAVRLLALEIGISNRQPAAAEAFATHDHAAAVDPLREALAEFAGRLKQLSARLRQENWAGVGD